MIAAPHWPSAEANDTLNGLLYAFEREDERHLRCNLGYWRMVEERMIVAQMRKDGVEPTSFQVSSKVAENHANDASYAEISRAWSLRNKTVAPLQFTAEELNFLADRFEFANDPAAQGIRDKAMKMLEPSS